MAAILSASRICDASSVIFSYFDLGHVSFADLF